MDDHTEDVEMSVDADDEVSVEDLQADADSPEHPTDDNGVEAEAEDDSARNRSKPPSPEDAHGPEEDARNDGSGNGDDVDNDDDQDEVQDTSSEEEGEEEELSVEDVEDFNVNGDMPSEPEAPEPILSPAPVSEPAPEEPADSSILPLSDSDKGAGRIGDGEQPKVRIYYTHARVGCFLLVF